MRPQEYRGVAYQCWRIQTPSKTYFRNLLGGGRRKRERAFRFPSLEACRDAFEKYIGAQLDWETGEVREA